MERGENLGYLLKNVGLNPEDMAWDHSMDISAAVYNRMNELGLKKKDLAQAMGVSQAMVTKILKGNQNLTLKTLAKLESALQMDMSAGFRCPLKKHSTCVEVISVSQAESSEPEKRKSTWLNFPVFQPVYLDLQEQGV